MIRNQSIQKINDEEFLVEPDEKKQENRREQIRKENNEPDFIQMGQKKMKLEKND
jgi:hypothetical protein